MANPLRKLSTFTAFICLAFLLFSINDEVVQIVEAEEYCGKPSATWKGFCFNFQNSHCDRQCKEREGLVGGLCIGFDCFCKFHCT